MAAANPVPSVRGPVPARQVSVVLPTYNEAGNIALLMQGLLDALGPEVEIIVVDDASPDGTAQAVRDFSADHPQVRLVYRSDERGLTSAIWRGISESQRPVVGWMDCDLSMPPADFPRILAALADHDLALGSRYVAGGGDQGHGWLGRALSQTICRLSRLLLGGQVLDLTSGFMAVRRYVLDELGLRGDYGEYCIDLIHRAQKRGFSAVEVPYLCVPRHSGQSKTSVGLMGFLRRGPGYLATVFRLWRREGRVRG